MDAGHPRTYAEDGVASNHAAVADMRGRVCVVTGATRGIGKATSLILAKLGATVVLVARDARRGESVVDEVRSESGNPDASLLVSDLASLASIRSAANQLAERFDAIHVLVNNAGVSIRRRSLSADGIEQTLAVNHLAPFALSRLLLPLLKRGAPSRIVNVSSELERWGRIDFDNLQMTRRYNGTRAYLQSKLANVMFTYELSEQTRDAGVTVNCVYPGLVTTDLLRERWWWSAAWLRPVWRAVFLAPEQAAAGVAHVASAAALEGLTGKCFDRSGRQVRTSSRSRDEALRRRLWRASEELTDLRFP